MGSGDWLSRYPITDKAGTCALAARGQTAADPHSIVMKSRRFTRSHCQWAPSRCLMQHKEYSKPGCNERCRGIHVDGAETPWRSFDKITALNRSENGVVYCNPSYPI